MNKILRLASLGLIFSVAFNSCQEDIPGPAQISGKWVESKNRADTIIFGYDNLVELKRGNTWQSSRAVVSSGAGLYKYKFRQDSIELKYLIRNQVIHKSFFFKMDEDLLNIGDFYNKYPGQNKSILFERLK